MSRATSRLAGAAAWSIGGSGLQYAISFGLLVYLAHILEPHDFGLIATVSIGLDLGTRVARWGQVELLQQTRYRSDQARNQSLRLSVAIGIAFTLAFLLVAGPVGAAFHSRVLTTMILVCAPVFLFSAVGSTAEALLRTEYRFHLIAVRNTVTALIGAVVAVWLIHWGYGVMALAVQRLVQAAIANLWVWSALHWRPRLSARTGWSTELFHEGTDIMLGTLMPLLVPRSIDLFVGAFIGTAQLGLMRVGTRINDFVGQVVVMPLVSVANTHLSALSADLAGIRASYLRLTQASAVLMCPSLVGLSLVAPEAIPLIFGAKWAGSVPFVQVTGLLGVVAPINYYFAPTMMALGRSKLVMRQGLIQVGLGLGLAICGAMISLLAVAVANLVRGTIVAVWNLAVLGKAMQLRARDVAAYLAAPYLGTMIMVLAVTLLRHVMPAETSAIVRLLVLSGAGAATFSAVVSGGHKLGWWPSHAALFRPAPRPSPVMAK